MNEQKIIQTLYKKLLALYPRGFRERLGEPMEQTFQDLYRERQEAKQRLFGFVSWTFLETSIGILKEHLLLIKEGNHMQTILTNLRVPAIIGLLLVLPFMIMEVVNRRSLNEGFPIVLFIIMWLLPVLFMLTGMPIIRNLRLAGNSTLVHPFILLLRVVLLAFLVWMWFGILIDQMPCFLGVPNCD